MASVGMSFIPSAMRPPGGGGGAPGVGGGGGGTSAVPGVGAAGSLSPDGPVSLGLAGSPDPFFSNGGGASPG